MPYNTRHPIKIAPCGKVKLMGSSEYSYWRDDIISPILGYLRFRPCALYGLVCIVAFLPPKVTQAGDIEPRSFINIPTGIEFLVIGGLHSEGGLSTTASSPLMDAHLNLDTGLMAYGKTLNLWGKSGIFDVIMPYTDLSGSALVSDEIITRQVTGLNDPSFRLSMNFVGAPALSLQEFSTYQQDLIIGASVQVSAPLGQYDPDRLINLGTNRWTIKPNLGLSKAYGAFAIELTAGVTFYGDNNDYMHGKTFQQEPVYTTQVHATYSFGRGLWVAVSSTYDNGGRTTTDNIRADDKQSNSRAGITLALPIDRNSSIKIYLSEGVAIRTGSDYTLIGVLWQYRWGSGL